MGEPWETMYCNVYAVKRLIQSVELARPWLTAGAQVWDVGCHRQALKLLLPTNVTYVGMDERMYGTASMDILDLDSPPYRTTRPAPQVIFALEVLEHVKHSQALLTWLSQQLAPGGRLVISLPNEATLFHRLRPLLSGLVDPEPFQLDKHVHRPSVGQSAKWLAQTVTIESQTPYIDCSGASSTHDFLGWWMQRFPDWAWVALARRWPAAWSRGTIFVCAPRPLAPS